MRLRTFTAPKMEDALRLIRTQLGPEALILSTRKVTSKEGHPSLEITAALPDDTPPEPAKHAALPNFAQPALMTPLAATNGAIAGESSVLGTLQVHGVATQVVAKLHTALPGLQAAGFGTTEALEMLLGKLLTLHLPPALLPAGTWHVLLGPPGGGKSTLLCQLAGQFGSHGQPVGLISLDNQTLGGQEALSATAEILGLPYLSTPTPAQLQSARAAAPAHTVWLIDTPGLTPYQPQTLARVQQQLAALQPAIGTTVHAHLVAPASLHPNELALLPSALQRFTLHSLCLTQLDATSHFGGPLNVAVQHGLPLGLASHSPSPAATPLTLTARWLAEALLNPPRSQWEFPA